MQTATLIYNDRVNTYREMKVLDAELDKRPTTKNVKAIAELRIRNLLCFSELQTFNDTGKWRYMHPLIACQSERSQLEELFKNDPSEFLRQYRACADNIKRYTSYLKNAKRSEKKKSDKLNLVRHQQKEVIFKSIIETNNKHNEKTDRDI